MKTYLHKKNWKNNVLSVWMNLIINPWFDKHNVCMSSMMIALMHGLIKIKFLFIKIIYFRIAQCAEKILI